VGDAGDRERAHEGPAAAVAHRPLELAGRLRGSPSGRCAMGISPPPGIAAEIGDPAVVRAAVRARQLGVHQLGFPQQTEGRIQDRLGHAFAIEQLHALRHVHGAERGAAQIGLLPPRTNPAPLVRTDRAAHGPLPQAPRLVHPLAHAAQRAELAGSGQGGAPAVDLQILVAVITDPDRDRAAAVAGLEILLPQVGRLEDVPVAIDDHRAGTIPERDRPWSVVIEAPAPEPPGTVSADAAFRDELGPLLLELEHLDHTRMLRFVHHDVGLREEHLIE